MSEIGKDFTPEVKEMIRRIRDTTFRNVPGDHEDVASLAKHFVALTAERDALKASLEWQPIETAPPGEHILFFPPMKHGHDWPAWIKVDRHPVSHPRKPTHWLPLPKPLVTQ